LVDLVHLFQYQENIDICTDILTLLLTKSLETGKVPSDWNHANVTPVLKKEDKHNPGNYKPISITCIACKLLEHIFFWGKNMCRHVPKVPYDSYAPGTLSKAFAKSIIIKSVCILITGNWQSAI
jgi:hypothetical protein